MSYYPVLLSWGHCLGSHLETAYSPLPSQTYICLLHNVTHTVWHSVVLDYVPSAASLTAAAPPAAVTIARYSAKGSNSQQQHILRHTATMRAVCSLVLGLRWSYHQPASSWWCMPVDNFVCFVCFVSSCSVCTFLCVMCCYAQFALHTQPMHLTPRHM